VSAVKTEDDPLDPTPPAGGRETSAAMNYLDQAVTDAVGIALRYGGFYGTPTDGLVKPVRERQFPIVGDGGIWSFIHLDDPPAATVLALEHDGDVPVGGHRAALPVSAVMNSSMRAKG
jgi:nucleoside-diphosphate-sugar epimerase